MKTKFIIVAILIALLIAASYMFYTNYGAQSPQTRTEIAKELTTFEQELNNLEKDAQIANILNRIEDIQQQAIKDSTKAALTTSTSSAKPVR